MEKPSQQQRPKRTTAWNRYFQNSGYPVGALKVLLVSAPLTLMTKLVLPFVPWFSFVKAISGWQVFTLIAANILVADIFIRWNSACGSWLQANPPKQWRIWPQSFSQWSNIGLTAIVLVLLLLWLVPNWSFSNIGDSISKAWDSAVNSLSAESPEPIDGAFQERRLNLLEQLGKATFDLAEKLSISELTSDEYSNALSDAFSAQGIIFGTYMAIKNLLGQSHSVGSGNGGIEPNVTDVDVSTIPTSPDGSVGTLSPLETAACNIAGFPKAHCETAPGFSQYWADAVKMNKADASYKINSISRCWLCGNILTGSGRSPEECNPWLPTRQGLNPITNVQQIAGSCLMPD